MKLENILYLTVFGVLLLVAGAFLLGRVVGRRATNFKRGLLRVAFLSAVVGAAFILGTLGLRAKFGEIITWEMALLAGALDLGLLAGYFSGTAAQQRQRPYKILVWVMLVLLVVDLGGFYNFNRQVTKVAMTLFGDKPRKPVAVVDQNCPQNLQLLYNVLKAYVETNGKLPAADNWMSDDDMVSHINKDEWLHCPIVSKGKDDKYGYAFNDKLSGMALKELNLMPNAAKTPLLYDSTNLAKNAHDAFASLPNPGRHDGKNTVLYCDGHVASVAP